MHDSLYLGVQIHVADYLMSPDMTLRKPGQARKLPFVKPRQARKLPFVKLYIYSAEAYDFDKSKYLTLGASLT